MCCATVLAYYKPSKRLQFLPVIESAPSLTERLQEAFIFIMNIFIIQVIALGHVCSVLAFEKSYKGYV